jgi:hypothetical protein
MHRRTARRIGVGRRDARVDRDGATDFVSVSVDETVTSFVGIVRRAGFEKLRSFVGWFKRTLPFARVCRVHPNVQTRVDVSMAMCAS